MRMFSICVNAELLTKEIADGSTFEILQGSELISGSCCSEA
jgi:hypothetical protein